MTTGNDTVTGAAGTLQTNDLIIDQQTTDSDVLNAVISSDNNAANPTVRKVEAINLDFKGFNLSYNAQNTQDGTITVSTTQAGNSKATVSGLADKLVNVAVGSGITTLDLRATSATTDATTVKLAGGALALDLLSGGDAVDTVTLNSVTAANTVTLADEVAATKLIVTGDKDLTIKTGNATFGSGGAVITNSLTGGAALTVDLTTVSGDAALSAFLPATAKVRISETVESGLTVTVLKGSTIDLAIAAALQQSGSSAVGGTLTTSESGTLNVLVSKATAAGTDDIFVGANVATLNLTNNAGAAIKLDKLVQSGAVGTTNILGSNDVTIADFVGASAGGSVLNAAGFTGKLTVSGATASGSNGVTIIGGDNGLVATGSAGVDTIVGGSSADTVTGTSGADSITLGGGADSLVLASGAGGSASGGVDTVTDFVKGTDKLVLTGAAGGAVDLSAIATTITAGSYTFGVNTNFQITLQSGGTGLTATNLVDSVQLGNATTAFVVASGESVVAGNYDDNIQVSGATSLSVKTGAGADKINVLTSGSAVITAGAGRDVIVLDASGASDVIKMAKGDGIVITTATNGLNVAAYDVVSGFEAASGGTVNDTIDLSAVISGSTYTGTGASGALQVATTFGSGLDLTANNMIYIVRGNESVGNFTESSTGSSLLVVYDADNSSAVSYETVLLTGVVASTLGAPSLSAGVISFA